METRNKFKNIANQIVTKEKFKGYIINNIEQSRAVDKIMMFASKYKVFLTNDLDAYHRGQIDKKQLTISIIFKLFYLITGLRFLMSAVINTKTITIVMSDSNYLLGNARLFSILYTNTEFIFLSINTIMLVFEYNNRLYLLTFLRNYKENLLMPMSATNSRKLVTITKIMTKYLDDSGILATNHTVQHHDQWVCHNGLLRPDFGISLVQRLSRVSLRLHLAYYH